MQCGSSQQRLGAHSQAFRPGVKLSAHNKRPHAPNFSQPRAPERNVSQAAVTDVATSTPSTTSSTAGSSRDQDTYFPSSLPPTEYKNTRCICVKEDAGLWVLQQDFPVAGPASINLNCVVSKLANGNLLVVSPVAPTPQCLAQLQQLPGTVQHILVPSCSPEHFYYTSALAQQYQEVQVWVPPGLFESKLPGLEDVLNPLRSNPRVKLITDSTFQQQLGTEVQFSLFDGGFGFQEATVFLPAQKAVVFSDLAFAAMNDEGMPLAVNKAIGKVRQQSHHPLNTL
eukprot:GHUV01017178.1.p1 GENE.GHUV01017178.1~~GHUV01017178.1.p1  ORF type:complete len:283 (+),score=76.63 GHUV01017178.1:253-1101(+)